MVSCCYRLLSFILLPLLLLAPSAFAEPLLWKVKSQETGGSAYLFGSIHFGTANLYPLPDYVISAFNRSDALVVELDLTTVDVAEASQILVNSGRLPKGDTLQNHLSQTQWDDLLDVTAYVGLPETTFQRLRPWLVAVQLTAAQIRRSGFSESYGVDKHILDLAKSQTPEKPVIQLESFVQQMALFDGMGEAEEIAFLQQALDEFHKTPKSLSAIVDAWKSGDETVLNELISGAFDQPEFQAEGSHGENNNAPVTDELYRRIFTDRNNSMQQVISNRLKKGEKLFVVVGAGHILGEDGLRARLQKEGFVVVQEGLVVEKGSFIE